MEPSPAFVQLASGADVVKIPIICIVFANGLVGYKAQIGYNLCTQSMELRALWKEKKRKKAFRSSDPRFLGLDVLSKSH